MNTHTHPNTDMNAGGTIIHNETYSLWQACKIIENKSIKKLQADQIWISIHHVFKESPFYMRFTWERCRWRRPSALWAYTLIYTVSPFICIQGGKSLSWRLQNNFPHHILKRETASNNVKWQGEKSVWNLQGSITVMKLKHQSISNRKQRNLQSRERWKMFAGLRIS